MAVKEIHEGIVEGITGFGAFIKLADGRKGLVHISEVAQDYVKEVSDHLNVGDGVDVVIIGEEEGGKLRLSIKQALLPTPEPPRSKPQGNFDELMQSYMKQSEERQLDLKRNIRKKYGSSRR